MPQISGSRFNNTRVPVDNQRFENCTFDKCVLVFSASGPVQLEGCTYNVCSFIFEGAAADTLRFMAMLYQLSPPAIEGMLDKIRGM